MNSSIVKRQCLLVIQFAIISYSFLCGIDRQTQILAIFILPMWSLSAAKLLKDMENVE